MLKAIFYKEFIKSRWYYLVASLVIVCFSAYAGLYLNRLAELAGMQNLWEYILAKNDSLVTIIKYVPLIAGIGGAVSQFAPEMYRKCLKLTLHLPYGHIKLIGAMLLFGVVALVVPSLLAILVLQLSIINILPYEIRIAILQATLPWFMAGIAGYLLASWVVLQPVWKKRIWQMVLSAFIIKIYFITDTPIAYVPSLWWIVITTPALCLLSVLSLNDFKEGRQD